MSLSKIFTDPRSLSPHLEDCKKRGLKIVFANGCFELLHIGHIRYLEAAKSLGDILVVAINTDESMSIIKPERRPAIPDRERFEIVAALGAVDYVVPLREETPILLIELFQPHIHTKGTDYTLEEIPERRAVESYGGRVELVGGPKIRNTRDLLKELAQRK